MKQRRFWAIVLSTMLALQLCLLPVAATEELNGPSVMPAWLAVDEEEPSQEGDGAGTAPAQEPGSGSPGTDLSGTGGDSENALPVEIGKWVETRTELTINEVPISDVDENGNPQQPPAINIDKDSVKFLYKFDWSLKETAEDGTTLAGLQAGQHFSITVALIPGLQQIGDGVTTLEGIFNTETDVYFADWKLTCNKDSGKLILDVTFAGDEVGKMDVDSVGGNVKNGGTISFSDYEEGKPQEIQIGSVTGSITFTPPTTEGGDNGGGNTGGGDTGEKPSWTQPKDPEINYREFKLGKGVHRQSGEFAQSPVIQWRLVALAELQKVQKEYLEARAAGNIYNFKEETDDCIIVDQLDKNQAFQIGHYLDAYKDRYKGDPVAPFYFELPLMVPGTGTFLNIGYYDVGNDNYMGDGDTITYVSGDHFTWRSTEAEVKETALSWTIDEATNRLIINVGKLGTETPLVGQPAGLAFPHPNDDESINCINFNEWKNWDGQLEKELDDRIEECQNALEELEAHKDEYQGDSKYLAKIDKWEKALKQYRETKIFYFGDPANPVQEGCGGRIYGFIMKYSSTVTNLGAGTYWNEATLSTFEKPTTNKTIEATYYYSSGGRGNYMPGTIVLSKVDSEDPEVTLSGATFHVYRAADNALMTFQEKKLIQEDMTYQYSEDGAVTKLVVNDDGKLVLHGLESGDYYLVEQDAPEGYNVDQTPIHVTSNVASVTTLPPFPNTKKTGGITLSKVDNDSKEPLAGVKFELWVQGENDTYQRYDDDVTYSTDENGQIKVEGLPVGKYWFKEVEALPGYELDETQGKFEIKEDQLVADGLTITNSKTPTGSVKLIKVDSEAEQTKLPGAEFKLYAKKDGKWELYREEVYTTDENGEINISGLPVGEYKFIEVKAPAGYQISVVERTFEIVKDTLITLVIGNVKILDTDPTHPPKDPETGDKDPDKEPDPDPKPPKPRPDPDPDPDPDPKPDPEPEPETPEVPETPPETTENPENPGTPETPVEPTNSPRVPQPGDPDYVELDENGVPKGSMEGEKDRKPKPGDPDYVELDENGIPRGSMEGEHLPQTGWNHTLVTAAAVGGAALLVLSFLLRVRRRRRQ